MYFVYVLRSLKNDKRYVGYTANLPEKRLQEHNQGKSAYTKRNCPFVLIYSESYKDKSAVLKRERFLKSGQGRKFLDQTIPP